MARPDGRQIWVNFAFPDYGRVQVIDTLERPGGPHAWSRARRILHMEFAPRGENVWLSARDDNKVVIYNTETFAKLGEIAADSAVRHLLHVAGRPYRLLSMDDTARLPPAQRLSARLPALPGAVCRTGVAPWCRREGRPRPAGEPAARRQDSRVGAVFAPKRIGASTLAAMAVPPEKLAAVAAAVNRFPEVNHNYEREHRYNLWFVVTAGSEGRLQATLGAIEQAPGYPLMPLPLLEEFHIDLGFSLNGEARPKPATARPGRPVQPIGEIERRLIPPCCRKACRCSSAPSS